MKASGRCDKGRSARWARRAGYLAIAAGFGLSALVWQAGCFAGPDVIRFSAVSDKSEYKKDEPVYLSFALKNTGAETIYINTRFYFSALERPGWQREVTLSVTSSSLEKIPCSMAYPTGLPRTDQIVTLKPGEEVQAERKQYINHSFNLKRPDTYTIVATYENACGAEIGVDTFKGPVTAQPIVIKVTE